MSPLLKGFGRPGTPKEKVVREGGKTDSGGKGAKMDVEVEEEREEGGVLGMGRG